MTEQMSELKIEASTERLPEVLGFVEERLEEAGCPPKAQMQICVAVEEIFVNIAQYAYAPGTGCTVIRMDVSGEPATATICFADRGVPFDPLTRPDPDLSLSAEEREVGGLGVYMTRQFVDDISYRYEDGQNILTLKKALRPGGKAPA